MKPLKHACVVLACASLLLGQLGCGTTSSVLSSTQFSESAYKADLEIKADAIALIDRAKNRAPYADATADVDRLMTKVDQAISTEQARPKNAPTVAQWKKIREQLTNLFALWKKQGSCSPAFASDAKAQVAGLFDILIKTENDKRKQS